MPAYGANAGAAIGTAIAPGVGTAIGGLFGSFMDGGVAGGSSSAPMNSSAAVYGSGLDGSGWAVNIGDGRQTANSTPVSSAGITPTVPSYPTSGFLSNFGGPSLASIPNWFWFAAVGVVLWKRSKSRA